MKNDIIPSEPSLKNLMEVAKRFPNEQSCRDYLEAIRWNGKPVCPHCGEDRVYKFSSGKLFKCAKCRKQFTVKVGTIFEDSPLPLQKWFFAIFILTSHKKGVSSLQLSRDIDVTQKTAWHMLHRIRYAVKTKSFNKPLSGIVEVDETYVGGKSRGFGTGMNQPNKTPVFGMVERGGEVRTMPVERANGVTLKPIIRKHIHPASVIMSDEFGAYYGLRKEYLAHLVINHQKMYVDGMIHTQNIENFWSLLKRGIFGIYHHVSKKHLHRYCDEYSYRYNNRRFKDVERFDGLLQDCSGRLTYHDLIKH